MATFALRCPRTVCLGLALAAATGWCKEEAPAPDAEYYAKTWMTDDGLPHNTVLNVEQDRQGYLWLGTSGGLSRFNGLQFKEFLLPSDYRNGGYNIRDLVQEDPDTLLLLPTGGQVVRWRDGQSSLHPASALVAGRQPTGLFVSPDKALWISLLDGTILRWKNGKALFFGRELGFAGGEDKASFAVDGEGSTWVAEGGFLGRFRHDQLIPLSIGGHEPMCIASGSDGKIWICTPTRLLALERDRLRTVSEDVPWKGSVKWVRHHFEDRSGALWIAAGRLGLFRWTPAGFVHVEAVRSLATFVTEDREGSLWLGTDGGGLMQLRKKSYRWFDSHTGLREDGSNAVFADRSGDAWLANNSGGLVHIRDNRAERLELALEGQPLYLSTGIFDAKGALWCGGHDGLYRLPAPYDAEPEKLPQPERNLHLLFSARNGDLWFAADPEGWGRYREGEPHLVTREEGYAGQTLRAMAEDRAGRVWAGALNGDLLCHDGGRVRVYDKNDGLPGQAILDLMMDEADNLWIATTGGLALKQGERFFVFSKKQGLADELLSRLLDDGRGNLWLAARSGLYFASKAELLATARGERKYFLCHRFRQDQGLTGISPKVNYQPSVARTPDGRLWFATSRGVLAVDAAPLSADRTPPPVLIEEVLVNDRPVPVRDGLEIPPGPQRIEFRFAVLSYLAPDTVCIRRKLEGADPTWVETNTTHTASFSGLAPGSYRLFVAAVDRSGLWDKTETSLSFTVRFAWWQQPWLLAAAAASAAGALVWTVRRLSQRALRRRLERLERVHALEMERSRIARDLHDDLGSSLTAVNMQVERLRQSPSGELPDGLESLAERTRRLSEELSTIIWTVSPKAGSLDQLAEFVCKHAQRVFRNSGIECLVRSETPIPPLPLAPGHPYHLLAVAKEALTNILKHAHAAHVTITLAFDAGVFRLRIEDDGTGFDPAQADAKLGNGLHNMRERAAAIGATLELASSPGRGTSVTIAFPCPVVPQPPP